MTDSDYSQEVNKMNEHDVSTDHSFTFISGYLWFWKILNMLLVLLILKVMVQVMI